MGKAIDTLTSTVQRIDESLELTEDILQEHINNLGASVYYTRESKLTYLAIERGLIKSPELTHKFNTTKSWSEDTECDLLVYSIKFKRYTLNSKQKLAKAKIKIYFCSSEDEYNAFMDALLLGADISNLWSKP